MVVIFHDFQWLLVIYSRNMLILHEAKFWHGFSYMIEEFLFITS